jgi:ribosome-associated protein
MPPQCSREVVVVSPVDPPTLVVSARTKPQRDCRSVLDKGNWNQEGAIEFEAVSADRVYFLRCVASPDKSVSSATGTFAADHQDFAAPRGPLALDSTQSRPEVEDEIVSSALGERAIDIDPELDRGPGDSHLGNRSFLIRCHASQRSDPIGWAVSVWYTRHPGYNSTEPKEATEPLSSLEQARRIAGLAEEKLAQDIVILDMRPVCAYTDFFVVCSGQNPRQTKAIVDEVRYGLKHGDEQVLPHSVEGEREGEWIVADYLDVVLHVFTPETRDYYGLEELWDDVPSIEHATAG